MVASSEWRTIVSGDGEHQVIWSKLIEDANHNDVDSEITCSFETLDWGWKRKQCKSQRHCMAMCEGLVGNVA